MPFLSAAAAAGGLLFAPMAAQNALATIATVGASRLEAEYEAITPVPWVGRHRTASATLTADLSATRYRIAIDTPGRRLPRLVRRFQRRDGRDRLVTPRGLVPLRFDSSVQDGSKHRRVLVDFTPGEVLVKRLAEIQRLGLPNAKRRPEARSGRSAHVRPRPRAAPTRDAAPIRAAVRSASSTASSAMTSA